MSIRLGAKMFKDFIERKASETKETITAAVTTVRRGNIATESFSPEDEKQPKVNIPKSDQTRRFILNALKENYLFGVLSTSDLNEVINAMPSVQRQNGTNIIQQGSEGDLFYVLETGTAEIIINGGHIGNYQPGACFGELALMYNAPRAATIKATSDCVLWTLDLKTFRRILATTASSQMMARCDFLRKVKLFEPMSNEQINKVACALEETSFPDGEYIIRQGDYGDKFYIIQSGTVRCTHRKSESDASETPLIDLHDGTYFGEMALMLDEPRHANCIAIGPVKCLSLTREQFIELLGPLQEVLTSQMRIRILRSVPLLNHFSDKDLDRLSRAMRVQIFEEDQYIVRQGEAGSRFYIINEGEVRVVKSDGGTDKELIRLTNQEFFGEQALLKQEPRAASIIACGRVECLVLERNDFKKHISKLQTAMEAEHKRRETMSAQQRDEPTAVKAVYNLNDINILRTVGTGTFGRVKLVQHRPTSLVCALKCMNKVQIVQSHQERNIMNEKNVLFACQHPFVLELIQTYNTPDQLMMLMELVQGGELWSYIYEKTSLIPRTRMPGGFTTPHAQFYCGCVISAYDYIHGMGVAYRDLKPENLLLDRRGFIKVIDFGFAKYIPYEKAGKVQTKSFTLCGTPEYLSPELIMSKGHDKSVDYWALGCLIYELLVGHTPFQHDHQAEIFKRIIHSDKALFIPRSMEAEAGDLIRKLLTPNPSFRLGNLNGAVRDIMNHQWFSMHNFSWEDLYNRRIESPYTPVIRDPLDVSNFDPYPEEDAVPRYRGPQDAFEGF